MEKTTHKFAIYIDKTLPAGKAINLASHLSAQFGTLIREIGGAPVVDASGLEHSGLPVCPNVILAVTTEELPAVTAMARQFAADGKIAFLDYTELGFSTTTDDEFRLEVGRLPSEAIIVRGGLVYGLRRDVNAITRGLQLWR